MGGMIAQTMAARHPDRVLSLVSIMSNTGSRWNGQPALRLYPFLLQAAAAGRGRPTSTHACWLFCAIGSPGFERDEDEPARARRAELRPRHQPAGTGRQLAAILASGDRTPALRAITAPTLVIHGKQRPAGAALGRTRHRARDPGRAASD